MTNNIRYWAFFSMFAGLAIVILSVTLDVLGGNEWWHLGTGMGTGLFTYGMVTEIWRRRGYYSRR